MENSDPESLPDESETVEYTLIIIKYDLEVGCFTADRPFKCTYYMYYASQARSRCTATESGVPLMTSHD